MRFLERLKFEWRSMRLARMQRARRLRVEREQRPLHFVHPPAGRDMRQAGFTLIELMVSIGILAILSALAVVSYSSYSIKAAAAEGPRLAESAMTAGVTTYQDIGIWPLSNADAGYQSQTGKYITAVGFDGNGLVSVIYGNNAPAPLAGTLLYYTAWLATDGATVVFTCGYSAAPTFAANAAMGIPAGPGTLLSGTAGAAITTVPPQYLPKNCRA